MSHIKFSHNLSDIPNEHPLLLVGEDHGHFVGNLYATRSLPFLKKKNYSHFFAELDPAMLPSFEQYKKQLKGQGAKALDRVIPDLQNNYFHLAVQMWQTNALDMKFVFSDKSSDFFFGDELNAAENTVSKKFEKQEQDSEYLLNQATERICSENPSVTKNQVSHAFSYGFIGEKTFGNFHETLPFTSEQKSQILTLAQSHIKIKLQKSKEISSCCFIEERNEKIAEIIANAHLKSPRSKMVSINGANHIHGTYSEPDSNGLLSSILKQDYNIASTTAVFVHPEKIKKTNSVLEKINLKKEYMDFKEFVSYATDIFALTPVEAAFTVTNKETTEGIYKLPENLGIRSDYIVVLPEASNHAVFENTKSKAGHLLNLK